VSKLALAYLM